MRFILGFRAPFFFSVGALPLRGGAPVIACFEKQKIQRGSSSYAIASLFVNYRMAR